MKKTALFALLVLLSSSLFSQGIKFEENHNLDDALAKAKIENKLVFIDAYASWCGPCKMMAAQIFPQQAVGDYFNNHFVCLKLDMEAPENLEIARKYEVKAYPTYLFLNNNAELQHRALGGMPAEDFIKVAKIAGDLENNFAGLSKKIKTGDRTAETLKKYIELNPYDNGNEKLVDEYFSTLKDEQKTSKDAWDMFNQFVKSSGSESFKYFLKNRSTFETTFGKKEVKDKIKDVFMNAYYNDEENFESLKTIDPAIFEETKTLIAINDAYKNYYGEASKENWDNLMKEVTPYLNAQNEDSEMLNNVSWMIYMSYKNFDDKKSFENALAWAKKATLISPEKDFILDTYAHLLYEAGKKKEAVEVETKALEIVQKSESKENVESYKESIEKFKN